MNSELGCRQQSKLRAPLGNQAEGLSTVSNYSRAFSSNMSNAPHYPVKLSDGREQ
jgi:hypothetical protein